MDEVCVLFLISTAFLSTDTQAPRIRALPEGTGIMKRAAKAFVCQ